MVCVSVISRGKRSLLIRQGRANLPKVLSYACGQRLNSRLSSDPWQITDSGLTSIRASRVVFSGNAGLGQVGGVPKLLTQYRVFIGSPGGLDEERGCFRHKLERYTALHSEPRSVAFHPVGWEETVGGVGRPQELINEDLSQCDYAVFVLHDRWGSLPGSGFTSGTEEEWALAEELYRANKIRNIALFFKKVDPRQMHDPGEQLKMVLAFKKRIEGEKRYLFRQYETIDQFAEALEGSLARWERDHEGTASSLSVSTAERTDAPALASVSSPGFDYWIAEAVKQLKADIPDYAGVLFCAKKATDAASSDVQWASGKNVGGVALSHLGKLDEAISAFTTVAERFTASVEVERLGWQAKALFNKGATLRALGRSVEEIAVYDDLLARFGTLMESPLREQVAKALFSKGFRLGALGRIEDAIAVYDDLLARFGTATELPLREQVANALFNKAGTFRALGRNEEAIAIYDDLLARFGAATELPLRKPVAQALFNKGATLGARGRSVEEIGIYDDLLARFGTATELPLREPVAQALFNKGATLGALGRSVEEIAAYDDLVARFGTATELPLREPVAKALLSKGFRLGALGRNEEAIGAYDDLLARFGTLMESSLRAAVFFGAALIGIKVAARAGASSEHLRAIARMALRSLR